MTELDLHLSGITGRADATDGAAQVTGGITATMRFLLGLSQGIQITAAILGGAALLVGGVLLWRRRAAARHRLASLPTVVKSAGIAVGVLAVVGIGSAGYMTYDYVQHDNTFCSSCHVMLDAYERFAQSAHSELGCHDCHQQPVTASLRQLYLWTVDRPEEVGPHAPVPDVRCHACHVDQEGDRWPQIAASLGHRVHFESDDPDLGELQCVSCHGVAVHEFAPAAATCGECHEEAEIQLGRMTGATEMHCVVCHDFLGRELVRLPGLPEGVAMAPARDQCLGCHEMRQLLVTEEFDAEPHGGVCGACHNPHEQTEPRQAVANCQGCHTEVETLNEFHGSLHAELQSNCARCHAAHSWKADMLECLDCHSGILEDDLTPPGRRRFGPDGMPRPFAGADTATIPADGPAAGGSRLRQPVAPAGGS